MSAGSAGMAFRRGGIVKNTVGIAHFLQVDTAVGRVDAPAAGGEAESDIFGAAAGILSGRNSAYAIADYVMSIDAAAGVNGDIAGLRAKRPGPGITLARGKIANN